MLTKPFHPWLDSFLLHCYPLILWWSYLDNFSSFKTAAIGYLSICFFTVVNKKMLVKVRFWWPSSLCIMQTHGPCRSSQVAVACPVCALAHPEHSSWAFRPNAHLAPAKGFFVMVFFVSSCCWPWAFLVYQLDVFCKYCHSHAGPHQPCLSLLSALFVHVSLYLLII